MKLTNGSRPIWSLSAILCDIPNIGKTFTARYYVQNHKNAVYIDCSQVKTKLKLVRKIAAEFGVDAKGKYSDVYEDLTYYLRSIENPLGKAFRQITVDELDELAVKLRSIQRKGGLKPRKEKQTINPVSMVSLIQIDPDAPAN